MTTMTGQRIALEKEKLEETLEEQKLAREELREEQEYTTGVELKNTKLMMAMIADLLVTARRKERD